MRERKKLNFNNVAIKISAPKCRGVPEIGVNERKIRK